MRSSLSATNNAPHPELVEGRRMAMERLFQPLRVPPAWAMRMVGMRMRRMVVMAVTIVVMVVMLMIMIMIMVVVMVVMLMIMVVVMMVMMIVRVIAVGADALDVMVVAGLRQPDFGLEADDLLSVLAHQAIHLAVADQDLLDAVGEGVEHEVVVVEIGRLEEFDRRMARRHLVGDAVDTLHQHAREEEIG